MRSHVYKYIKKSTFSMPLSEILKGILNLQKEIDTKILPSLGLFYKDDFRVFIKKASVEDIIDYEHDFDLENVGLIIHKIKKIAEKNTILSHGYSYLDIKSIDIVFLFLEIVKFTKNEPIIFPFVNQLSGAKNTIEFSSKTFNYFQPTDKIMKSYNNDLKCFEIYGYKFTAPAIGIENSISNFLIDKNSKPNPQRFNTYYYDFTYFILDKNRLDFGEIENLIQIFNFDIETEELEKVKKIVNIFLPIQRYSLIQNGVVIDINAKIDLGKVWK